MVMRDVHTPRTHCEISLPMSVASGGHHWGSRTTGGIVPPNSPSYQSVVVIQDFRVSLHRGPPIIIDPSLEVLVDSVEHLV